MRNKKLIFSKKGMSIIEVLVALSVIALFTKYFIESSIMQKDEANKVLVAQHFDKVIQATSSFFEEERCLKGLKDGITKGQITETFNVYDTTTANIDGILGVCKNKDNINIGNLNNFIINKDIFDSMQYVSEYNIYHQRYRGTIRATPDGKPLLIIYSESRTNKNYNKNFINKTIPIIANFIGSYAGYMPDNNNVLGTINGIAIGASKGWNYNFTKAKLPQVKAGNLVGIKVLGEASVFIDIKDDHLLHRQPDPNNPNSGYNKMEWNLDMTGNKIENIGGLELSDNSIGSIDSIDCTKSKDGTIFYRKVNELTKGIFVCINGKAEQVNTSGNSMNIKEIYLVEANATSPNKYITPPKCYLADGTSVEATAFISPTVMSSGSGTSPTATGNSIISIKTWIEKVGDKWKPRMVIKNIENKTIVPQGVHSRILVMAICPTIK